MVVHYQPILSLREGRIVGFEALARLRDGERVLSPAEFLPHLGRKERRDLSRLALAQGLGLLERLDAKGIAMDLSINVDPDFMIDHDCAQCFVQTVSRTSIAPSRITLEILEDSDFLSLELVSKRLAAIKATGARIALDDVGSAYSSLLRLKELPIDEIKLDQNFVRDLAEHPENIIFVQSIHALAQGMGAQLVVEGVETEAILDAMIALNIEAVQGYAIAKPMSAEAILLWQQDWRYPGDLGPHTLLGAYAGHVDRIEVVRHLIGKNLDVPADLLRSLQPCPLNIYMEQYGIKDQVLAEAYREVMSSIETFGKQSTADTFTAIFHGEKLLLEAVRSALSQNRYLRTPCRTR